MKVLYFAPDGGPGTLTGVSFVDEELVALQKRGIEAHLLAPEGDGDEIVEGIRKRSVRAVAGRIDAARLLAGWARRIPWQVAVAEMRDLLYSLKAEAAAAKLARNEGFDLIHSHFGSFGGLGGLIAAELAHIPLVATFRGMDLNLKPGYDYGLRRRSLFDANVRQLLAHADHTLYVSENMRQTGLSLGATPSRAHTVLKGVDLSRFAPTGEQARAKAKLGLRGFVVLTVAALQPWKGIDVVLRALSKLAPLQELQYVICGDGEARKQLNALSSELGLDENVRFVGRVSREAVAAYLSAADLFIMTSLGEGSGNVYLEAQASGKPCIAADSGGAPEYVLDGRTGFIVPFGNPDRLAQRIRALIEDPGLCREMGRAARLHMERGFSYRRMEDDIFRAYHRVLGGRGGANVSQSQ